MFVKYSITALFYLQRSQAKAAVEERSYDNIVSRSRGIKQHTPIIIFKAENRHSHLPMSVCLRKQRVKTPLSHVAPATERSLMNPLQMSHNTEISRRASNCQTSGSVLNSTANNSCTSHSNASRIIYHLFASEQPQ